MKQATLLIFIALAVIQISSGCKKQSYSYDKAPVTATSGTNEVWLQNIAITPGSITVPVNTTIKWTNKDGFTHSVTSNNALFDSGNLNSGSTYSHQFTTAGSYQYHCSIHSTMKGTVIVQ